MPKIFFCYRRDDSKYQAGRLFDQLSAKFGHDQVFKDVDSIPLGKDFRRVLQSKVGECDILLALVGDDWLTAKNAIGERRLDDPADFVRIEIETALARDIPVIPLLVGNAPMPPAERLPASLKDFAYRHGMPVRPDPDFHQDVKRLVAGIAEVTGPSESIALLEPLIEAPPSFSPEPRVSEKNSSRNRRSQGKSKPKSREKVEGEISLVGALVILVLVLVMTFAMEWKGYEYTVLWAQINFLAFIPLISLLLARTLCLRVANSVSQAFLLNVIATTLFASGLGIFQGITIDLGHFAASQKFSTAVWEYGFLVDLILGLMFGLLGGFKTLRLFEGGR